MKTKQLGVSLSIHNRRNVRAEAALHDESVSEFIRAAVREELKKMNLPISENQDD